MSALPDIASRIARFPVRTVSAGGRAIAWREAGGGEPLVLLHGIGNQSGSWVQQLESLAGRFRVIAWDAPGYGASDALPDDAPVAADYARALHALLDALAFERVTLVGSSLGCLMAASYAKLHPARVARLVLCNAAAGHGSLDPRDRQEKLAARLAMLERLGPAGMAAQPSAGLLSEQASDTARALAAWSTAQLRPAGYAQAARMLSTGRLLDDAPHYGGPVLVIGSSADTITPPASCRAIAAAYPQAQYVELPGVGHLAYIEDPQAIDRLVTEFAGDAAARPAPLEPSR
jgi:pimeloyl-ACP methyl ester carboxylesterase